MRNVQITGILEIQMAQIETLKKNKEVVVLKENDMKAGAHNKKGNSVLYGAPVTAVSQRPVTRR